MIEGLCNILIQLLRSRVSVEKFIDLTPNLLWTNYRASERTCQPSQRLSVPLIKLAHSLLYWRQEAL